MYEMYCCPDCNKVYEQDEVEVYYERGEAWGSEYVTTEYLCPFCHEYVRHIDSVDYCDNCGEPCLYDFIETKDGNHYCSDCYIRKDID